MHSVTEFGKYTLVREVATGGMAEVFLARQQGPAGFEKNLVVKRILPHLTKDENFITMFLDEAKTSAQFNHPNLVQIYELGEIDGAYYIAMEYIEGKSLKDIISKLKQLGLHMPLQMAAKILANVCAGLDYAHTFKDATGQPLNLVHRDISPDNILVSYSGGIKIIDFGIAKARSTQTVTQAGMLKGKFSYMSPEQVQGKTLDKRSDVFALGIVLNELTTHQRPFGGSTEVVTVTAIIHDDPTPATDVLEGYPVALWDVIQGTLEKDPEQRCSSAADLQEQLEQFIHQRGDYVTERDIGQYITKLFHDDNAYVAELREMGTDLKPRLKIETGDEHFATGETAYSPSIDVDSTASTAHQETPLASMSAEAPSPAESAQSLDPRNEDSHTNSGRYNWILGLALVLAMAVGGFFGYRALFPKPDGSAAKPAQQATNSSEQPSTPPLKPQPDNGESTGSDNAEATANTAVESAPSPPPAATKGSPVTPQPTVGIPTSDKPSVDSDKPSVDGDKPQVDGDTPPVHGDQPQVDGDKAVSPTPDAPKTNDADDSGATNSESPETQTPDPNKPPKKPETIESAQPTTVPAAAPVVPPTTNPKPVRGTISFRLPRGTIVVLNGRRLGTAPVAKRRVRMGTHKIILKHPTRPGSVYRRVKLSPARKKAVVTF